MVECGTTYSIHHTYRGLIFKKNDEISSYILSNGTINAGNGHISTSGSMKASKLRLLGQGNSFGFSAENGNQLLIEDNAGISGQVLTSGGPNGSISWKTPALQSILEDGNLTVNGTLTVGTTFGITSTGVLRLSAPNGITTNTSIHTGSGNLITSSLVVGTTFGITSAGVLRLSSPNGINLSGPSINMGNGNLTVNGALSVGTTFGITSTGVLRLSAPNGIITNTSINTGTAGITVGGIITGSTFGITSAGTLLLSSVGGITTNNSNLHLGTGSLTSDSVHASSIQLNEGLLLTSENGVPKLSIHGNEGTSGQQLTSGGTLGIYWSDSSSTLSNVLTAGSTANINQNIYLSNNQNASLNTTELNRNGNIYLEGKYAVNHIESNTLSHKGLSLISEFTGYSTKSTLLGTSLFFSNSALNQHISYSQLGINSEGSSFYITNDAISIGGLAGDSSTIQIGHGGTYRSSTRIDGRVVLNDILYSGGDGGSQQIGVTSYTIPSNSLRNLFYTVLIVGLANPTPVILPTDDVEGKYITIYNAYTNPVVIQGTSSRKIIGGSNGSVGGETITLAYNQSVQLLTAGAAGFLVIKEHSHNLTSVLSAGSSSVGQSIQMSASSDKYLGVQTIVNPPAGGIQIKGNLTETTVDMVSLGPSLMTMIGSSHTTSYGSTSIDCDGTFSIKGTFLNIGASTTNSIYIGHQMGEPSMTYMNGKTKFNDLMFSGGDGGSQQIMVSSYSIPDYTTRNMFYTLLIAGLSNPTPVILPTDDVAGRYITIYNAYTNPVVIQGTSSRKIIGGANGGIGGETLTLAYNQSVQLLSAGEAGFLVISRDLSRELQDFSSILSIGSTASIGQSLTFPVNGTSGNTISANGMVMNVLSQGSTFVNRMKVDSNEISIFNSQVNSDPLVPEYNTYQDARKLTITAKETIDGITSEHHINIQAYHSGIQIGLDNNIGISGQVLTSGGSGSVYWSDKGTGPTGATGPAGTNGIDGATGPAGPAGATGPAGTNGIDGATGPAGPAGATGPAGTNGIDGATGPAGPAGATGPAGTNGLDGATGPAGPAGATGPAGTNGIDGATGPAGPAGATGPAGAAGATGPAGTNGLDGATGPAGPAGPAGATGPTGPTGPAGPTGPSGSGSGTVTGISSTVNVDITAGVGYTINLNSPINVGSSTITMVHTATLPSIGVTTSLSGIGITYQGTTGFIFDGVNPFKFIKSPSVPTPNLGPDLATKEYVDQTVGNYGGNGLVLYFNNPTGSPLTGVLNKSLVSTALLAVNTTVSTTSVLIAKFTTPAGFPKFTAIPTGLWKSTIYGYSSSTTGDLKYFFRVYKNTTLIGTSGTSYDVNTTLSNPGSFESTLAFTSEVSFISTDTLSVELWCSASGVPTSTVLTTYFHGDKYSFLTTSLSGGVSLLTSANTWSGTNTFTTPMSVSGTTTTTISGDGLRTTSNKLQVVVDADNNGMIWTNNKLIIAPRSTSNGTGGGMLDFNMGYDGIINIPEAIQSMAVEGWIYAAARPRRIDMRMQNTGTNGLFLVNGTSNAELSTSSTLNSPISFKIVANTKSINFTTSSTASTLLLNNNAGTVGQVLTSGGPSGDISWTTISGGGGSLIASNNVWTGTNEFSNGLSVPSGKSITGGSTIRVGIGTTVGIDLTTSLAYNQMLLNNNAGTAGQVLTSGGPSGNLSWATITGSGGSLIASNNVWTGTNEFSNGISVPSGKSITGGSTIRVGIGTTLGIDLTTSLAYNQILLDNNAGTEGQVLTSGGPTGDISWTTISGGGGGVVLPSLQLVTTTSGNVNYSLSLTTIAVGYVWITPNAGPTTARNLILPTAPPIGYTIHVKNNTAASWLVVIPSAITNGSVYGSGNSTTSFAGNNLTVAANGTQILRYAGLVTIGTTPRIVWIT